MDFEKVITEDLDGSLYSLCRQCYPTDYTRIDDWVQRIKSWKEQGISKVYFFMHQHEELHSPELARYLIQQLNKHCGTTIQEPKFISPDNSLFD